MQLNIKNVIVRDMATRLAALTGKSVTQVVGDALRRELAEIDRERDIERRRAELARIVAMVPANRRASPMTDAEFDAWMYDENGVPH